MIQAHKLPRWNKFKIVPTQESFATWIDEVRFVEEMIENPLMLNRFKHENGYSRPSINPYGSEMIYKMLMNYAYTVLGLRGKAVKEFMFNTMKNVAQCYHEMMMEIDKKYAERENDSFYKKLCGCSRHEHNMKRAFDDWDSYGVRVCYGCEVTYEDRYKDRTYYTTYTPMMLLQSRKCLNVWEFLQSVRPQTMAQDIVIYEDELQAILDLFGDDLHKILIAYSMIVRAKLFEQSRCYWDNKTVVDDVTGEVFSVSQTSEAKHWNTPCITERMNRRSSYLIKELGFEDRRGILNLYGEVLKEMFQAELFEDTWLLMKGNGGCLQTQYKIFDNDGYRYSYTIKDFDMKKKKVKLKRGRSAKGYVKATMSKDMIGSYKAKFLTLHDDTKKVALIIDYYTLTHGYVLDLVEYLGNIGHMSVEKNKFRIITCSDCGKRSLVVMDGKKGKMPKYCEECGSPKAKMRRKRSKD